MDTPFLSKVEFENIFKHHLRVQTSSESIDNLLSPRMLNRIDFKPYYQRNYVWDNNKATYFIESILLGTEIPPLVFFKKGRNIEVIDGRQRFETIIRFRNNKFGLSKKGLSVLKQLSKITYDNLNLSNINIIDLFLDTKIRIIEFEIVNEPPMDDRLEDKIKKEIFRRYNTGITSLKKAEIDNAVYDTDILSNSFKKRLQQKEDANLFYHIFFKVQKKYINFPPIEQLMTYIRRQLVFPMYPVVYYARGTGRTESLTNLYSFFSSQAVNPKEVVESFFNKVYFIKKIKDYSEQNNLLVNRLALTTFIWGLSILETEKVDYKKSKKLIALIAKHINDNFTDYSEQDYHFYQSILDRYTSTSMFLEKEFCINLNLYVFGSDKKRQEIKELKQSDKEVITQISELESLRLKKPEPSRSSISDIVRRMNRRKFLVRPSYQRSEVINLTKASGIIESILLGISLPPLFIYKRENGVCEVIDGQQRILTLLGFIGEGYQNLNGNLSYPKCSNFSLRKLKILPELIGEKFTNLTEDYKDKILDYKLYIVDIEESNNPSFNPIDLFIRLNDKPYPIREHSFEMWNSWADKDIIQEIRELKSKFQSWFYLRKTEKSSYRDRMENEELILTLSYFDYNKKQIHSRKFLDIYQKKNKINARIGNKKGISNHLSNCFEYKKNKHNFLLSIKNVRKFIRKLKLVLIDKNLDENAVSGYLSSELDKLFKADTLSRYSRRTMQDFYILWYSLYDINYEMVKHHRLTIKNQLRNIFMLMKNIPEDAIENNIGLKTFNSKIKDFKCQYQKDSRKTKLTYKQKSNMLNLQDNTCAISGALVFMGDDIDVDHDIPLSIGGKDAITNLQITHRDSNNKKGSRKI